MVAMNLCDSIVTETEGVCVCVWMKTYLQQCFVLGGIEGVVYTVPHCHIWLLYLVCLGQLVWTLRLFTGATELSFHT